MGKRKRRQRAEPRLFDLPLHSPGEEPSAEEAQDGPSILFDDEEPAPASGAGDGSQLDLIELGAGGGREPVSAEAELGADAEEPDSDVAYLGDRLLGGLADLCAQIIMLGLAVAATHWLGIAVSLDDWEPFSVLLLVFSFLYWVVPLAFWGQTPGMAWVGHTARATNGEPLSFGQTFLRWLGSVLTLAFAGLPLLVAVTGRSFTDRLSDSRTRTFQGGYS